MTRFFSALTVLILFAVALVACTATDTGSPSAIDLSGVRTILPTVAPADVEAVAQLADDDTLALGQQIYAAHCASCHGVNGEGQFPDAPMQPDETGRIGAPPHNSNGHTWHHGDDLLYEIVRDGGVGMPDQFYPMPAFADQLDDLEIEAVIAYIKTMWTEEQRRIQAERTLLARQQSQ